MSWGRVSVAYPDWLEELVDRLQALGAMQQRPTQVSVNHYVPHPEPYRLVVRRHSSNSIPSLRVCLCVCVCVCVCVRVSCVVCVVRVVG